MTKFIISTKEGKSYKHELDVDLQGRKIGEKLEGSDIGLKNFIFQITGGSDDSGFPMRPDIDSRDKKSALIGSGPGVKIKRKGMRIRKTVRGNTISPSIIQVNLKLLEGKDIGKVLGIEKKEETTKEHPEEGPKEKKGK